MSAPPTTPGSGTEASEEFRCGHVAVVGRPNVGKSTLVNRLLGHKLNITSNRPQTTRHRVLGVKTTGAAQIILVDTPGIHRRAHRALNRYMNRTAVNALGGVDVVLMVVEALAWREEDEMALARVREHGHPTVLALNKVDRIADKAELLPFIERCASLAEFRHTVPVSALRGTQMEDLEAVLVDLLPRRPPEYPDDQLTDRSERFLAAELVREKLTRRLGREVPYRLSVEVEHFEEDADLARLGVVVWVERTSHKPIVIGRRGEMLKLVGTEARRDIEALLGRRAHLEIWVKVREDWSDDGRALVSLGYDE